MKNVSVLYRFVDWSKAAENVLRWYEQALSALAKPGESRMETEQRLKNLCAQEKSGQEGSEEGGMKPAPPKQDAFLAGSRELAEFLAIFFEAWERLSFREQMILREFYINRGEGTLDAINRIGALLNYERTKIYEIKKSALARFSFMLFRNV